jgi:hypothetical protein
MHFFRWRDDPNFVSIEGSRWWVTHTHTAKGGMEVRMISLDYFVSKTKNWKGDQKVVWYSGRYRSHPPPIRYSIDTGEGGIFYSGRCFVCLIFLPFFILFVRIAINSAASFERRLNVKWRWKLPRWLFRHQSTRISVFSLSSLFLSYLLLFGFQWRSFSIHWIFTWTFCSVPVTTEILPTSMLRALFSTETSHRGQGN